MSSFESTRTPLVEPGPVELAAKGNASHAIQLFVTCLIETICPAAGMAVVRVLERLGVRIEYPEGQTCCGQPAFNGGAWREAREMACYTLDVLARSSLPIVIPSGSCADMIVHHYSELLRDDTRYGPIATEIASRTYEFSQFLVEILGVDGLAAKYPGRVTYHPSCHLTRALGVVEPPRRLLAHVQGAEIVELPNASDCCGFGGLFAIKMGEISSALLERKLDAIARTGATTVVGGDVSCLLHLAGGLHRRGLNVQTKHLAEILAAHE